MDKFKIVVAGEIDALLQIFGSHHGKPFNPRHDLCQYVKGTICLMIFGHSHHEPERPLIDAPLQKYLDDADWRFSVSGQAGLLQAFPFMRYVPGPLRDVANKLLNIVVITRQYMKDTIKEHRERMAEQPDEEPEINDYVDAFVLKQNDDIKANGEPDPAFTGVQNHFHDSA